VRPSAPARFRTRIVTFPLYVFLALWSIGFGYGFWWSLISGEEATRTGLSGCRRMRAMPPPLSRPARCVRGQLDSVVTWSTARWRARRRAAAAAARRPAPAVDRSTMPRRSVRDSVTTLRDGMTRSWLEPVQVDIEQLRQAAAGLGGTTVEERQRNFEARASDIRGRARNIAARSNQLGKSTAGEMRALASTVAIAPGAAGFSCYDPTLAERLRAAAGQAEQPAELKLREAVFSEGPAGVANAVKNLWRNMGAYRSGSVHYVFSRGETGVVGRTDYGRADHRPRPDRPARHHRHRSRPAGAGDRQSATRAALDPSDGALKRQINEAIDTAIARAGVTHHWSKAISFITTRHPISLYPTSTVAMRRRQTRRSR
jgi:hypothetical protein